MDFRFKTEIRVAFRDLDAMGHVNNAVYLSYFEIGRMDFYDALFGVKGFKRFPFILGEVKVRYLSPANIREVLEIHVGVGEIGRKAFTFEYLITEKETGRRVAEGTSVQVMFDYESKASCEVPEEFRLAVAAHQG